MKIGYILLLIFWLVFIILLTYAFGEVSPHF